MKKIMLMVLLMLISVFPVLGLTESFTTRLNVTTGNGYVNLYSEDSTLTNINCNNSFNYPWVIELERSFEDVSCPSPNVNYTMIENIVRYYMDNASFKGMNSSEMSDVLKNIIPEQFANQQDFIMETWLPQQQELENLKGDLLVCQGQQSNLKQQINFTITEYLFVNQTKAERIEELKNDNSLMSWVVVIVCIALLVMILDKVDLLRKLKVMTRN